MKQLVLQIPCMFHFAISLNAFDACKNFIKRACCDIHTSRTYFPTSKDVGMYLALSWTPVRIDGKRGKALVTSSSAPVMPGKNLILFSVYSASVDIVYKASIMNLKVSYLPVGTDPCFS